MNGKLLSQLPDFLCENELVERLKILPNYNINIANETMSTRLLALSELYDIYIPSQLSVDVYNKLYMALLRSIKKKENDMMVKQQRIENTTNTIQTYNGIIGGADSFTIIGVSGIGKSSAITRAISLIFENHFIETTDPYQRIAPFILVQCPFDSSVKSLLLEIVRILDATLDGDYLQIAQRYTTDRLIGFVSQICLNHVGVLIVDEIQNVVNNKNGDKLIGALTQIINSSGISVCMVGTPECLHWFESAPHLERRTIGLRYLRTDYDDDFIHFCKNLLKFQYVQQYTEPSEKFINWLYAHSNGVTSTVVSLFYRAQELAIMSNTEKLSIDIFNASYNGMMSMQVEKVQKKNSQTANKSHKEITIHHSNGVNIADLYNYSKSNNYDLLALIKNTFTVEEVEIC